MRAGDLTSAQLGKTIRFESGNENARTVYTDVLIGVKHWREDPKNPTALDILSPKIFTTLHLQRLKWNRGTGLFGLPNMEDVGIDVSVDTEIEVLS